MKWTKNNKIYIARGMRYDYASAEVNGHWMLLIDALTRTETSLRITLEVKDIKIAKQVAELLEK